jgi:hypothetical protein
VWTVEDAEREGVSGKGIVGAEAGGGDAEVVGRRAMLAQDALRVI